MRRIAWIVLFVASAAGGATRSIPSDVANVRSVIRELAHRSSAGVENFAFKDGSRGVFTRITGAGDRREPSAHVAIQRTRGKGSITRVFDIYFGVPRYVRTIRKF